jgi:zinc transport system ATP-binding protein
MKLLSVRDLCFSYGQGADVLERVSFELGQGEILGILGPNGGGKSTLLKLITGLLKAQEGHLEFFKEGKTVPRPALTYIPQKENLNHSYPLTVEEYLLGSRLPRAKVTKEELAQALKRVSFSKDPSQKLSTLSGGEYQRVLLAKAYLNHSSLVLMDEPTKGLDGVGQDRLLELIHTFKNENNAGIILVEHNIAQALKHSDRLLCLNRSFHWHDHRDLINKNILEDTYHCEFEHLLIHEQKGDILNHEHHKCEEGEE